jgi:hypothetical protein
VTDGVDDILASQHNTPLQDIAADANIARPVVAGGTGATTASGARTALGLVIGTDVQAQNANLQLEANLTPLANTFSYYTSPTTKDLASLTAAGGVFLAQPTVADQRTALGLGALATASTITTAEIAPAALRTRAEGVGTPLDTEVPTVNSMVGHVSDVVAPYPFKSEFVSAQQTITSGGALTIAHPFGVAPKLITIELVCITPEQGFGAGNVVPIGIMSAPGGSGGRNLVVVPDTANLNVRFSSSANVFIVLNFGTGADVVLTNANWRVVFRAYN